MAFHSKVSGDQGMLQQQIHWWLGGVQERRNATGYVHFCAPLEPCSDGGGSVFFFDRLGEYCASLLENLEMGFSPIEILIL